MPSKLWIDVEDLFEYAVLNPRPSGIQRVEFELCRALAELDPAGERVRFIRHAKARPTFEPVAWASVERLFGALALGERKPAAVASAALPADATAAKGFRAATRSVLRKAAYRLPPDVRHPLVQGAAHQIAVFRFMRDAARAGFAARQQAGPGALVPPASLAAEASAAEAERIEAFATAAGPGDVLAVLGSPWFHTEYATLVRRAQGLGLRFALMIYDLIPLRRPEWCDRGLIQMFDAWLSSVLPLADAVLTISRASAGDVVRHCAEAGIPLRGMPQVIPMGTGFGQANCGEAAARFGAGRALPAPGSYALIVSTIEARKNHMLLFRVWRRLLEELPREEVPTLVFAGRVGWLVSDLMQQLRNAQFLGGKILLVEDPTDAELERLYRGCLFTLFPSLYEGWGLPVTESLAFGRPCIASNATSLPEAGGALARYFDPESTTDAHRVIRDSIRDLAALEAWRERVAREFVPVAWRDSAAAVLRALAM